MKRIVMILSASLLLTGCGSSLTAQVAETPVTEDQPAAAAETDASASLPELPDLSAFDIDTGNLTESDKPTTVELNSGRCAFEGEVPEYSWQTYENAEGASFCTDSEGRLRRFRNTDAIYFSSHQDEAQMDAEAYKSIAESFVSAVVPDAETYSLSDQSIFCKKIGDEFRPCEYVLERKYSDFCYDTISVSLNAAGQVRMFESGYCGIAPERAEETEAAMLAQLDAYLGENKQADRIEGYIVDLDGQTYGCFSYRLGVYLTGEIAEMMPEEDRTVYSAESVILRAEE